MRRRRSGFQSSSRATGPCRHRPRGQEGERRTIRSSCGGFGRGGRNGASSPPLSLSPNSFLSLGMSRWHRPPRARRSRSDQNPYRPLRRVNIRALEIRRREFRARDRGAAAARNKKGKAAETHRSGGRAESIGLAAAAAKQGRGRDAAAAASAAAERKRCGDDGDDDKEEEVEVEAGDVEVASACCSGDAAP